MRDGTLRDGSKFHAINSQCALESLYMEMIYLLGQTYKTVNLLAETADFVFTSSTEKFV